MTVTGWTQIVFFFATVVAVTKPLGAFIYRVLEGERHLLSRPLAWLERLVLRLGGVTAHEQSCKAYSAALLAFSAVALLVAYAIQRLQHLLPLNPQGMGPVEADSAFNTAASFTSNTNWQSYVGEASMSYLTQMAAFTWHNFISAAAGIAVAAALARGITRRGEGKLSGTVGNFWVDLTRATIYVLLPICVIVGLAFASQGVIQNFHSYQEAITLEGVRQLIAMGPVASQEAIKQLGTNGAGFFNANAAHPFENPTPVTNFLSLVLIFAIPAGLTYTFGRMAKDQRQGWVLFGAMALLFACGVAAAYWAEASGNPSIEKLGVNPGAGNLEGKEVRFGVAGSALYATVTTDASCGAVNAMHDSFTPLGGLVPLFNIQLGEVVFGGVGAGLYGILIMAILSVFLAGLMVGRTPEYLGKKIESREIKLAMLYVLVFPMLVLGFTAISSVAPYALSALNNAGPHGLTQILYAYSSAAGNNGSAFAGLGANTLWYNTTLGLVMLGGRFLMIVPVLAIAGRLAGKQAAPAGPGTLATSNPLFALLLVGVILIVGALTFFPALCLAPIVEHFLAQSGKVF